MLLVFGMPADIVLGKIVPGIGLAIFAGNLWYFYEAWALAQQEKRQDVTAQPFGIGDSQLTGWLYLIMGPVYWQTGDAELKAAITNVVALGLTGIGMIHSKGLLFTESYSPDLGFVAAYCVLIAAFLVLHFLKFNHKAHQADLDAEKAAALEAAKQNKQGGPTTMKTLVITGAARENGHTAKMVELFLNTLGGEYTIIDAYRAENIAPCKDCRYCWHKKGCSIHDGMDEVYRLLEGADNVVLASPMYFHSITGKMKALIDRFQVYWAGHVRNDMPEKPLRKGAILMVGGAPSFPNQFLGGELVLKHLLNDLSTQCLGEVCLPNSDHDSLETRPDIAQQVVELAEKMKAANE